MASQWPYGYQAPQGNGYDQYVQQYQQSASQQYGHQPSQQYGQSMPHQFGQQASQQYGQPMSQPYEQQQQQYPHQYPHQYPQQQSQQYSNPAPHQYPQTHYQQPAPQYPQQSLSQQYPAQQSGQYLAQQLGQYPAQQSGQYASQQSGQYQIQQSGQYPQQSGQYPQQYGQYPSPHPGASTPAYPNQAQAQPGQQTCYNCGATGHWAQDCPEPRRQTPAGSYGRPPPPKRQKPNPPVVTKYPIPSHVQSHPGQAGQVYGTPYPQSNYSQYQATPGPPTPMSGQSSANQQWPQQQYGQQYHQPYAQQQHYPQSHQQAGYQPQQSAIPTAPPTPSTPYSVHHSPEASAQAGQANKAGFFQAPGTFQQSSNAMHQLSSASPHSTAASTASQAQKYYSQPAAATASSTHSSRRSSVSMRSMSLTPKPQGMEDSDDADDFSQLDIPDIPPTRIGNIEYPPPRLVDRSLPTNFVVADALDPFDPPLPENDGCCRSKYTAQDASSTFLNSIRDTRHWQEFKSDPIFASVHINRQVIPLDVIISTYQASYEDVEHGQVEAEEQGWTSDARPSVDCEEAKEVPNRLDHPERAQESAKNPPAVPYPLSSDHKSQSGPSNRGTLPGLAASGRPPWGLPPRPEVSAYRKRDRPDEETTASQWPAKLARIGRIVNRTCPPPPALPESPTASPGAVASPPRSRTPSMFELSNEYSQHDIASSNAFDTTFTGNGMQGTLHHGLPDPFEPPPPPPSARLHRPASYDGAGERPLTAGSPNGCLNGDGVYGSQNGNGNGRSHSQDHANSPSRLRSETNGRKSLSEQQDLSDDDNTPKRRQVDDTKSKLRKRQPTVAAAYR
ncbi:MAG: hypothetical protein Q9174_001664 [Haloplaca sp. 1 TL-2023]